jgi:hypothetical protein
MPFTEDGPEITTEEAGNAEHGEEIIDGLSTQ